MADPRVYKVHAIVLKRRNIGESDRVLTLFTKEYGKMVALAKGVRKITSRRAPHIEIFTQTALILHHGKTWDIVTDAQTLEGYGSFRKDLTKVSAAYFLCEIIDQLLPEHQEHRDIYNFFCDALEELDKKADFEVLPFCQARALTLLERLGFISRVSPAHTPYTFDEVQALVESVIEKRLRTPKFIQQLR